MSSWSPTRGPHSAAEIWSGIVSVEVKAEVARAKLANVDNKLDKLHIVSQFRVCVNDLR